MKVFPEYELIYPSSIWNLNDFIYMKVTECNQVGYKYELEFRIKEVDTLIYDNVVDNEYDYTVAQYEFIDCLAKFVKKLCKDLIVLNNN